MRKQITRLLLIVLGWLAIALGVIGIFLPILPTTPFILLAAFCFVRSSPRFHTWLLQNRFLGPIVHSFEKAQGIPRRVRQRAAIMTWISLSISMLLVGKWWITLLLCLIGVAVTIYLYKLPASKETIEAAE